MDMLVPLYRIPESAPLIRTLATDHRIIIRHPQTFDITPLRAFIETHFSPAWGDETAAAFRHMPPSCLIAIHETRIIGFAAYDVTRKAFFGPTGVDQAFRKKGIGTALLVRSMECLRDMGYGYAIIGWAGPTEFYSRAVGATLIPDSEPGVYAHPVAR